MSVTGVCSVCGTASAQRVCDRCGNVVCEDHHDPRGVCTECAAEIGGGREGNVGDDPSGHGPAGPR
ncbi:hypothetical protein [Halobacterium rubrum]|uniref:hypothetical protein n=1 Tax=Halobacterium TaxID=2239 RepID=UPI001F463A3E|nr:MULTISPECIES: hypothetical protein [Halobacterium]MDH5019571.1 hypothetical protein [Halobacterium rubrum]